MPLTLIATSGAADANAYATVAEATTYADYRVGGAAFIALTSDQKIQALVTATRDIDTLEDDPGFTGDRFFAVQALAWPRDEAALPRNLVRANIELAMSYAPAFAAGSTTDVLNADPGNGNIQEETVGPITTVYFAPGSTAATAFERFPAIVQRLLYSLVIHPASSSWGSAVVSRGS